ncbi:hypothetical protein ON010_g6217 [Phytophthora cinnamomi]|nr:hypothetical protein ON010_g6217 [Phytophthora cinnamomi]
MNPHSPTYASACTSYQWFYSSLYLLYSCVSNIQSQTADPTDGDAILDTEHQMRAEPFAPQIFSPSKPAPAAGTKHSWKSKSDGLVSKVRGSVGDVLRKALRKSHRDLTLLRSRGQHLLSQQSNNSSSMGTVGAVETIQERGFIVVCLQQCCAGTSQFAAYKCNIREVAAKVEKTTAASLTKSSGVLEALFQPQTAEFLKLAPGKSVKLYEPLHVVAEHVAAGSTKKPRWFLLSTQLAEVVDDNF